MKKRKMPIGNKKTVNVSFRCTAEQDRQIEAIAKSMGEKKSEFILDCVEAGLKRKTRYDKGKVRALVEMQETMNQMIMSLGDGQKEIREQILEYGERTMKLWEY